MTTPDPTSVLSGRALPEEWDPGDVTVAGVDIGGTQCSVNLGRCRAGRFELVRREQFATDARRGPDAVLGDIETRLRGLLADGPGPAIVGVSCGGPLDPTNGIVQSPPNLPGWDDVPLTSRLAAALDVPCVLDNDANASALAEWAFGAARGLDDLVYLTFGTGLGAGMVLAGAPYRGLGDLAGEVGHWRLGPDVGPVHYGKRGSFEGYCSGSGIVEWYLHLGAEQPGWELDEPLSAEVIARRARDGEALAGRVFDQAARQLGKGVALLVDALAPEMVVIGGIYVYATDLLEQGMWAELSVEAHPQLGRDCKIVPAGLGPQVGSYASCCVALSDLIGLSARALSSGRTAGGQTGALHARP